MLMHPNIDPVALKLGPLSIHWYGLTYLLGFWIAWGMAIRRARLPHVDWSRDRMADLLFYVVMGVILGGRIGYVLFYAYDAAGHWLPASDRSEEHTSELQSLMRISYAVFCLKKKKHYI